MADIPSEELRPHPDTVTGADLVDPEVAADAAAERVRELMVVVFAVEGAVGDDVIATWSFGEKPLVLHASDLRELLESRDQLKAEVETLRARRRRDEPSVMDLEEVFKRLWAIAAGWRTYEGGQARVRMERLAVDGRVSWNDAQFVKSALHAFSLIRSVVRPGPLPGVVALWAASDAMRRQADEFHGLDGEYQRRLARWLDDCSDALQDAGDDEGAAGPEVRAALGIARALLGEPDPAETVAAGPTGAGDPS